MEELIKKLTHTADLVELTLRSSVETEVVEIIGRLTEQLEEINRKSLKDLEVSETKRRAVVAEQGVWVRKLRHKPGKLEFRPTFRSLRRK